MIFLFVILIIMAASLVVYALLRGLHAFVDPKRITEDNQSKSFETQNKMMFARVKWQAIVIMIIVILMYVWGAK
jgi:cytochrome c-type biogenesis protein CcmE